MSAPVAVACLCMYMLYSSITVVGWGALLLAGLSRLVSTPRQALQQTAD
ncbi:hypothetical protein [Pseudomonas sp. BW7P1]|nr:hypothetical protein [Pseudomonas sp. BW7P1]UWI64126.1 hypothetical protein NWV16_12230 [Pseudomonas sp. BW7P1]